MTLLDIDDTTEALIAAAHDDEHDDVGETVRAALEVYVELENAEEMRPVSEPPTPGVRL